MVVGPKWRAYQRIAVLTVDLGAISVNWRDDDVVKPPAKRKQTTPTVRAETQLNLNPIRAEPKSWPKVSTAPAPTVAR